MHSRSNSKESNSWIGRGKLHCPVTVPCASAAEHIYQQQIDRHHTIYLYYQGGGVYKKCYRDGCGTHSEDFQTPGSMLKTIQLMWVGQSLELLCRSLGLYIWGSEIPRNPGKKRSHFGFRVYGWWAYINLAGLALDVYQTPLIRLPFEA